MKLTKKRLKEIIKEEILNEGPAYEYSAELKKISNLYKDYQNTASRYWDAVNDFGRVLEKKGLKKQSKFLIGQSKKLFMTYKKQVSGFKEWFDKFVGGLM